MINAMELLELNLMSSFKICSKFRLARSNLRREVKIELFWYFANVIITKDITTNGITK